MNDEIVLEKVLLEFSEKLPKFEDGRIDYSTSDKAPVLNCFVKFENKILLLKRSEKVHTYQGLWNFVGGYLDEFVALEEKVLEELREELGIMPDLVLEIKKGKPFEFFDEVAGKTWFIFPILAELKVQPEIKLDWEHTAFEWIEPTELKNFEVVSGLEKILESLLEK
ncbi:MAG: NUDIX domain-containing protein [Candidatus Moraniibacteriota bacterium]